MLVFVVDALVAGMDSFEFVMGTIKLLIVLGIFNVWLLRFNKPTAWRGGAATTLPQEFAVYGLPNWSCPAVGFFKLSAAICLLIGFWIPELVRPAGLVIAALMLAAVVCHIKVADPLLRALPAFCMFVLSSLVVVFGH
jgi:hypothetical protein